MVDLLNLQYQCANKKISELGKYNLNKTHFLIINKKYKPNMIHRTTTTGCGNAMDTASDALKESYQDNIDETKRGTPLTNFYTNYPTFLIHENNFVGPKRAALFLSIELLATMNSIILVLIVITSLASMGLFYTTMPQDERLQIILYWQICQNCTNIMNMNETFSLGVYLLIATSLDKSKYNNIWTQDRNMYYFKHALQMYPITNLKSIREAQYLLYFNRFQNVEDDRQTCDWRNAEVKTREKFVPREPFVTRKTFVTRLCLFILSLHHQYYLYLRQFKEIFGCGYATYHSMYTVSFQTKLTLTKYLYVTPIYSQEKVKPIPKQYCVLLLQILCDCLQTRLAIKTVKICANYYFTPVTASTLSYYLPDYISAENIKFKWNYSAGVAHFDLDRLQKTWIRLILKSKEANNIDLSSKRIYDYYFVSYSILIISYYDSTETSTEGLKFKKGYPMDQVHLDLDSKINNTGIRIILKQELRYREAKFKPCIWLITLTITQIYNSKILMPVIVRIYTISLFALISIRKYISIHAG
jgi:hypothetical protein